MKIKKFFKPSNSAGKSQAGFTLIELLVVIGIIAVLATIGTISFNSAAGKSRNAKRQADLRTIASGLEIFNANEGTYPSDGNAIVAADISLWSNFLSKISVSSITAPRSSERYCYYTDTLNNPQKYVLIATDFEGEVAEGSVAFPAVGNVLTGYTLNTHSTDAAAAIPGVAECTGAGDVANDPNCVAGGTADAIGNDYCIGTTI